MPFVTAQCQTSCMPSPSGRRCSPVARRPVRSALAAKTLGPENSCRCALHLAVIPVFSMIMTFLKNRNGFPSASDERHKALGAARPGVPAPGLVRPGSPPLPSLFQSLSTSPPQVQPSFYINQNLVLALIIIIISGRSYIIDCKY